MHFFRVCCCVAVYLVLVLCFTASITFECRTISLSEYIFNQFWEHFYSFSKRYSSHVSVFVFFSHRLILSSNCQGFDFFSCCLSTTPLHFCWSILYVRLSSIPFHFMFIWRTLLCINVPHHALHCLLLFCLVVREGCILFSVSLQSIFDLDSFICSERVCTQRIHHTHYTALHNAHHAIYTRHFTSNALCIIIWPFSVLVQIFFFVLSLCACVVMALTTTILNHFFMMAGKLHAFTHRMRRWSIIYFIFNIWI